MLGRERCPISVRIGRPCIVGQGPAVSNKAHTSGSGDNLTGMGALRYVKTKVQQCTDR